MIVRKQFEMQFVATYHEKHILLLIPVPLSSSFSPLLDPFAYFWYPALSLSWLRYFIRGKKKGPPKRRRRRRQSYTDFLPLFGTKKAENVRKPSFFFLASSGWERISPPPQPPFSRVSQPSLFLSSRNVSTLQKKSKKRRSKEKFGRTH